MNFKTELKGKKILKNAAASRKTVTISLSTRDIENLEKLSDSLHYSKSSIISALLEQASDPSNPKGFNNLANFFTDYELARGQNVKKNKVSFNGPAASLNDDNYDSGGEDPLASVTLTKQDKVSITPLLNCNCKHNGHYPQLPSYNSPESQKTTLENDTATIFDTQGNAYNVKLSGGRIPFFFAPLSVYDTVDGERSRASETVVAQIMRKLVNGEARLVAEADQSGILRFTGISTFSKRGGTPENDIAEAMNACAIPYHPTSDDARAFWDLETGERLGQEGEEKANAFLSRDGKYYDGFFDELISGLKAPFALSFSEERDLYAKWIAENKAKLDEEFRELTGGVS
jgi:hypothetical protein